MKPQISSAAKLVLIAMVIFIAGSLGYGDRTAAEETPAQAAKEKTMQVLKAIGGYTADQRDEAVRKAKETLADMDIRIERLETQYSQKWDQMDQSARSSAQQTLTALRKQRSKAAEWYGGLKHSSSNVWEDVKTGFLESYHQLQGAFENAAREF